MSTLPKLLEKRGIKSKDELDPDEKATFEGWERILSGEKVTVENIAIFCENQLANIEAQFKDLDAPLEKKGRLTLLHSVYSSLLGLIKNPDKQKEALEQYLQTLV